jgi:hypothetical protein
MTLIRAAVLAALAAGGVALAAPLFDGHLMAATRPSLQPRRSTSQANAGSASIRRQRLGSCSKR